MCHYTRVVTIGMVLGLFINPVFMVIENPPVLQPVRESPTYTSMDNPSTSMTLQMTSGSKKPWYMYIITTRPYTQQPHTTTTQNPTSDSDITTDVAVMDKPTMVTVDHVTMDAAVTSQPLQESPGLSPRAQASLGVLLTRLLNGTSLAGVLAERMAILLPCPGGPDCDGVLCVGVTCPGDEDDVGYNGQDSGAAAYTVTVICLCGFR